MSNRIGNPQQINFATARLGSTLGVTIPLTNSGWALFISASMTFIATATTGARQVVFNFADTNNNVIWKAKAPAQVLAGQTVTMALASRIQGDSIDMRTLQMVVAYGLAQQSGTTGLTGPLDEIDALRADVDANPLPMIQSIVLPEGFSIPVNSTITVLDANAVDNNDTVNATIVYTL